MKTGVLLFLMIGTAAAGYYYPVHFNDLGCWNDKPDRAIPTLEGKDDRLSGHYRERILSIQKCAAAAHTRGYDVFAIQHGGWCASAHDARATYRKYKASKKCESDWKGGEWSNQVYELSSVGKVSVEKLGCWTDTAHRAIPTLEHIDRFLDGSYRSRKGAFEKCLQAAFARGYEVFALQHGGWCAASRDGLKTYQKYGKSKHCLPGGKGGPWANEVYRIEVHDVKYYY